MLLGMTLMMTSAETHALSKAIELSPLAVFHMDMDLRCHSRHYLSVVRAVVFVSQERPN